MIESDFERTNVHWNAVLLQRIKLRWTEMHFTEKLSRLNVNILPSMNVCVEMILFSFRHFNVCFLIEINETVKHLTISEERSMLWWIELFVISQNKWHHSISLSQTRWTRIFVPFQLDWQKVDCFVIVYSLQPKTIYLWFHRRYIKGWWIPCSTNVHESISNWSHVKANTNQSTDPSPAKNPIVLFW